MEIIIRKAEKEDMPQLPSIFRDANETLRKSRGGLTPDEDVDHLNSMDDESLKRMFRRSSIIFVAEVRETGMLAGMGALTDNTLSRMLGSTYSRNHYVRASFQGGKAGVSVGRLLREATISEARRLGFRKMYGFSTPDSAGFHSKFGAVFYPRHDARFAGKANLRYYEIELRKSILNGVRIEPYVHLLGRLYGQALSLILMRGRREQ
jgi:L-amino acid N-acyltransferase YncA